MDMNMTYNVNELYGDILDHAVAIAIGYVGIRRVDGINQPYDYLVNDTGGEYHLEYYWGPSQKWSQAGPLIQLEGITITPGRSSRISGWTAWPRYEEDYKFEDVDCLVAAMRCFVFSRLGETVDIPENFLIEE